MLGSLASRGRYQDTVDRSKANAALGDLKSIDNLEATGDLSAAEAKALRDAAKTAKIRDKIPNKLLDSNGNVDLSKFDNKVRGGSMKNSKTGWHIEKDHAGHWGTKSGDNHPWKLYDDKNRRIATIDNDGRILKE